MCGLIQDVQYATSFNDKNILHDIVETSYFTHISIIVHEIV